MRWLNYIRRSSAKQSNNVIPPVRLVLDGWSEEGSTKELRVWKNACGDVLTLANAPPVRLTNFEQADELKVRNWCREFAQRQGAGLIEARKFEDGFNFIYKKLRIPAYVYMGVYFTRARETWFFWVTLAGEHGTTGVREAFVTAFLFKEGKLKPEEYESRWAQDPYDPAYCKVDRSVLRFLSDDESYDHTFPHHPLSKVRRTLALLPSSVKYDFPSP